MLQPNIFRLRSDSSYDNFYNSLVEASTNLTDKPVLRRLIISRRHEQGAENHQYTTPVSTLGDNPLRF